MSQCFPTESAILGRRFMKLGQIRPNRGHFAVSTSLCLFSFVCPHDPNLCLLLPSCGRSVRNSQTNILVDSQQGTTRIFGIGKKHKPPLREHWLGFHSLIQNRQVAKSPLLDLLVLPACPQVCLDMPQQRVPSMLLFVRVFSSGNPI